MTASVVIAIVGVCAWVLLLAFVAEREIAELRGRVEALKALLEILGERVAALEPDEDTPSTWRAK